MVALRQIQDVKANKLVLNLPLDFKAGRVEVIILPIEDALKPVSGLNKILLSAPTLSKKDLHPLEHNRKWIEKWDVREF